MNGKHLENGLLLSGFKGSGKDTLADKVVRTLIAEGIFAKKYVLAYRLKEACCLIANVTMDEIEDRVLKEKTLDQPIILTNEHINIFFDVFKVKRPKEADVHIGKEMPTLRKLMQYGGTEVLRSSNADIHCIKTLEVIEKERPEFFIVSDNRFMNEIEFFPKCKRLFVNRVAVEPEITPELHKSELMMFEIKKTTPNIDNNGTLEEFNARADQVASEVLEFIQNVRLGKICKNVA